jgi:hypothetical protein
MSRFKADLYTALALLLIIGIVAFVYMSWIGHALVRPIILAGPTPWAHLIVMEAKEHIFIFLPIIALALSVTLATLDGEALLKNPKSRRALAMVASLALFMVLIVFLMGAIISNAGKIGLEV